MKTNISLNEIAYGFRELYRAKFKDTDSPDIRLVKYWVQEVRAKLIKQKVDKLGMFQIDEVFVQSIPSTLERVSSSQVSFAGLTLSTIDPDIYLYRTVRNIPQVIEKQGTAGVFTRIGPERSSLGYLILPYGQWLTAGYGAFNRQFVYATYLDRRIYLKSGNPSNLGSITAIEVRGVFQNPVEAALIADPTYTDDDDYPISQAMVDDIYTILMSKEFKATYAQPEDKIANASNDLSDAGIRTIKQQ